jgi:hypothetical protein
MTASTANPRDQQALPCPRVTHEHQGGFQGNPLRSAAGAYARTAADWTDEEDAILLSMRQAGDSYPTIAKALRGRTAGGCNVRWERLNRDTALSCKESELSFAAMSEEGSRHLLRAQLRTGQHFIHERADHLAALKAAGY